jgi:hypothetical protein
MFRSKIFYIVLLSLFILLFAGVGGIYFLLTNVYHSDDNKVNRDALKMIEWEKNDPYSSPQNGIITEVQLDRFLKANRELSSFIFKVRQQFEEKSWRIAFDIIRMRPEWIAAKFKALEKSDLSPNEYDWIVDRVIDFWVYRWKEESIERLNQYGWEFEEMRSDTTKPVNYQLLLAHEQELSMIFDILWPEKPSRIIAPQDSVNSSALEK